MIRFRTTDHSGTKAGGDCQFSRFAGRVGTPCRPRRSRGDRPTGFGNCRYGYTYGPSPDLFAFGFSTKYHDRELGLIAYQRRFYVPQKGRWLNRDPLCESGGLNLYGYVRNSPLVLYDKIGLMAVYTVNSTLGTPFYSDQSDLWMGVYVVLDKADLSGDIVLKRSISADYKPCDRGKDALAPLSQHIVSFVSVKEGKAPSSSTRPFGWGAKQTIDYPYFEVVRLGKKNWCGKLRVEFSVSFRPHGERIEAGAETQLNFFETLDVAHGITNFNFSGKDGAYSSVASLRMELTYRCNDSTSPELTAFSRKGAWGTGPVLDRAGKDGVLRSQGGDGDAPQAHPYERP